MSSQKQETVKRITVPDITARKGGEPIVFLTAYDAPTAEILDEHCDVLLVGDSVGMVVHGLPDTVGVTLEMMILHGQAVMRGAKRAMVVIDMPFGCYEGGVEQAYANAVRVMKETGAQAVKVESGPTVAATIDYLVQRGIPVMGHVGLLPQAVLIDGAFKAKGATRRRARAHSAVRPRHGRRRRLRRGHRGRGRGAGARDHRGDRQADHRHRRLGRLRRPDAGDADMLGLFDWTPEVRAPIRRSARRDRPGGRSLCRRCEGPPFSCRSRDLLLEKAGSAVVPVLSSRGVARARATL